MITPDKSLPEAQSLPPKKRRFAWWWEGLLLVSLFFALRAYMSYGTASGEAPPLHGTLLDGTSVSLQAYRGRPVLVYFWATWCSVCKLMQGSVAAVAEDYPVLSVALKSGNHAAIQAYLQERGVTLPVILDPDGRLATAYGVQGVPAAFVVDAVGNIRFVEIGYTTEIGLRARLYWAQ